MKDWNLLLTLTPPERPSTVCFTTGGKYLVASAHDRLYIYSKGNIFGEGWQFQETILLDANEEILEGYEHRSLVASNLGGYIAYLTRNTDTGEFKAVVRESENAWNIRFTTPNLTPDSTFFAKPFLGFSPNSSKLGVWAYGLSLQELRVYNVYTGDLLYSNNLWSSGSPVYNNLTISDEYIAFSWKTYGNVGVSIHKLEEGLPSHTSWLLATTGTLNEDAHPGCYRFSRNGKYLGTPVRYRVSVGGTLFWRGLSRLYNVNSGAFDLEHSFTHGDGSTWDTDVDILTTLENEALAVWSTADYRTVWGGGNWRSSRLRTHMRLESTSNWVSSYRDLRHIDNIPESVAFSPCGNYIATTNRYGDEIYVYTWRNLFVKENASWYPVRAHTKNEDETWKPLEVVRL